MFSGVFQCQKNRFFANIDFNADIDADVDADANAGAGVDGNVEVKGGKG